MHPYLGVVQFAGGDKDDRLFLLEHFSTFFLLWENQLLVGISLLDGQIRQNQLMLLRHKAMGDTPIPWFGPICRGDEDERHFYWRYV